MPAQRLTFQVPTPSPLCRMTARQPGLALEGFPVGPRLLVRATGKVRPEALEELGRVLPGGNGDGPAMLVEGSAPEGRLVRHVEAAEGIVVPPLRWAGGQVALQAVLPHAEALARLRRSVPRLQVLAKEPVSLERMSAEMLGYGRVFPEFSKRQAEAVLTALRMGYYDTPRKATTGEVARAMDIARSTFEEHLKRGEAQMVGAVAPIVALRLLGDAPEARQLHDALHTYARFSEALGLYVEMMVRGDKVARVRLTRRRPPAAEEDHPYLARILRHLATGEDDLRDIPLDLEVTPFERAVLEKMRDIPVGEVRTYGELARALGKPGAARPIGNVCAKNPVPLVVPCHRVVPGDGRVGDYSAEGGAATKRKVLEREGAWPPRRPRTR